MKRILIVEDDKTICELMRDLLISAGYDVSAFSSPTEALEFLQNESPYDLILLDLMMPEIDGAEFRRRQWDMGKWDKVPVVLVSASAQVNARKGELKAAGVLAKPFELSEILKVAEKYSG